MRSVRGCFSMVPFLLAISFIIPLLWSDSFAEGTRGVSASTLETSAVILYDHPGFNGHFEIFFYDEANLEGNYVGNDDVSSVQLVGNATCTLYEDAKYGGTSIEITESVDSLDAMDEEVSSIKVYGANYSGIILYGEANFGGLSDLFIADDNSLVDNWVMLNDWVSSVRVVGEGISADLYVDKDFQNWCAYVTEDIDNLEDHGCNDKISSIRVYGFQNRSVVLYRDQNFRGGSQIFIADDADFCNGEYFLCMAQADEIGNDSVSSVRLLGDATCTLYEDNFLGGNALEITESGNVPAEMDEEASSIRLDLPVPPTPVWGLTPEAEASVRGEVRIGVSRTGNALSLLVLPMSAIIALKIRRRNR